MLLSLAVLFGAGILFSGMAEKVRIPRLAGMILAGIIIGPFALNLLSDSLLNISADLRQIALVIILIRAGLSLSLKDLKQVGRPAILMCFVPAVFEIIGVTLLAPKFLHIPVLDAALMGTVLGAVSPAVIVPKMLKLMDEGYGTEKSIPQLILAGASVDDVFVIVLFSAFTGLSQTGQFSAGTLLQIPLSIATGLLIGYLGGRFWGFLYGKIPLKRAIQVLLFLSLAFVLVSTEDLLEGILPFSGLLATMMAGIAFQKDQPEISVAMAGSFNQLWQGAEILLFVLVGATVDIQYATAAGPAALLLIVSVLVFRMCGVWLSLLGTNLTKKERLFCVIAYMPKATVQAAIGGIPLAMGLSNGELILTVAVLSILITAPVGAGLIEGTYTKLLEKHS